MCGIAGVFNYRSQDQPVDAALVRRMTDVLTHRGPDDAGVLIDGPLGMGNRRLAIVDLGPTGRQPMRTADGSAAITYNGEFYDHARFRRSLERRGRRFRGTSDTETMLHLIAEDGPRALADVAAIFGLAFWDPRARRLVLARDPLGVKQVYYHDDGRRILFASEIKSVLQSGSVPRRVDPESVSQYLHFHTPLFERTFFADVKQLRPGEFMEVDERGIRMTTYWRVSDFVPQDGSPSEIVERLRSLLQAVVKDQLLSDVPVGAFFSGGIDSGAVAAYAARTGRPPVCFGVHFSGEDVVDERPYQEAAASALGVELELLTLDGRTFADDLPRLIYHQDEPVIGAAMIPMFHVSRLAARRVKVCLGGQGGDEIFGGYARYALAEPGHVLGALFRRGPVGDGHRVGGNLLRQLVARGNMRRISRAVSFRDWESRYFDHFARIGEDEWRGLLDPSLVSRENAREIYRSTLAASPARRPADKVMHWDVQTYLPGLFHQDDRMSMASGLESRVPLADPRLVAFAFTCPFDVKFKDGASKWVLRQAVADVLPSDVITRRKVGFDTPVARWMRDEHRDFVRDTLLSSRARARGILRPDGVERLLASPHRPNWSDLVWKTLCIETWAAVFLDTSAPSETPDAVADVALS